MISTIPTALFYFFELNWLAIPWVGESTENPFEGSVDDVPITSMSRAIEIDLRDMFGEENLPEPLVANSNNILM